MSNNTDITDSKARFWGNIVKYGFLVVGLAVFAPVIWLAFGGFLGLVLGGGVALGTWALKEPAFTFAANMRLKLIKEVVAQSPVPTLQNEHLERTKAVEASRKSLEEVNASNRMLDQTIDQLEAEFPEDPQLPQLRADQAELLSLYNARAQDLQDAYVTLGDFGNEIKRASRLWDTQLALAKARGHLMGEQAWLSTFKTQTAFDTIRKSFDTQLASLSTDRIKADADRILKGKAAKTAIPAANVRPTIDITTSAKTAS